MELWIRSQDKLDLMKCKSIHIEEIPSSNEVEILCYASGDKYSIVGCYETKERALEVFDEIQKFISEGGIVEFRESQIVGRMESYKKTVYEMPKE